MEAPALSLPAPVRRLTPPFWMFAALLAMTGLHLALPVAQLFSWPGTLWGVVPLLLGLHLTWGAEKQFKKRGNSVRPLSAPAALVTTGWYRFSRNPMYLGMAVVLAGAGLMLGSVTPLLLVPAFLWWVRKRFIRPEEVFLAGQFGQDWTAYAARTRRWI